MNLLKKLKKRRKGVVDMTPIKYTKPERDNMIYSDVVGYVEKKKAKEVSLEDLQEELKDSLEEELKKTYSPELVKQFEEENPGKHAKWRGNWTKQFITWAKNANPT